MDAHNIWHEELPEQCPPGDAFEPNNFRCYRLCEQTPFTESDFLSQRALAPEKVFNAPECIARAVSVFTGIEDCINLRKLAIHKKKVVASLTLNPGAGMVKKTGKARTHHSWWRSSSFDPLLIAEVAEIDQ